MEGLVGIWRKLVIVTVLWATGSFLLSQGVAWGTFQAIDSRNEALVCLWGIIVVGILSTAAFLLAANYAGQVTDRPRLARLPPIEKDLDLTAGRRAFNTIQWAVLLGTVVWPLYCEAHFLDKIARVPIYPCLARLSSGRCEPDFRGAAAVSQWYPHLPMRIYRFGVGANSQGVDFVPLLEPMLYIFAVIGAFGSAGFLAFRLLRPSVAPAGPSNPGGREASITPNRTEVALDSMADVSLSGLSLRACVNKYKEADYQPISRNTSRIGSEVLQHLTSGKVAKFGQDPAYDVFVSNVMAAPSEHLPHFYRHKKPKGPFIALSNDAYTLTEMEYLVPLTSDEASGILAWIEAIFDALTKHSDPAEVPDPYGLTEDFLRLRNIAVNHGVNIDLLKPENYMARVTSGGRQIVFTDPYS